MKRLLAFALLLVPGLVHAQQPAFPGAVGGGALSVGGRGGTVILVTNINDSGTGSLRACLTASGPRNCVPTVGGTLVLQSSIVITNPFVTFYGQAAPGGGFQITNSSGLVADFIRSCTHDVIVQYYRARGQSPYNTTNGTQFAILTAIGNSCSADVYNNIVDHVSMAQGLFDNAGSWGTTNTVRNVTYSHNILAEPLWVPNDSSGLNTGCGANLPACANNQVFVDFYQNWFHSSAHRNPISRGFSAQIANNLVYNGAYYDIKGGGNKDIMGNYVKAGPYLPHATEAVSEIQSWPASAADAGTSAPPSLFISGNGADSNSFNCAANQWTGTLTGMATGEDNSDSVTSPISTSFQRTTQLTNTGIQIALANLIACTSVGNPSGPIVTGDGAAVKLNDTACTGGFVANRDSMDARYATEFTNSTGISSNLITPNALPVLATGTACASSLNDGIPNAWKTANGLSLTNTNLQSTNAGDGYTYLEHYMYNLALPSPGSGSFFAQTAAGAGTGASCATARALSSYTSSDPVVILCGTISGSAGATGLTIAANGTSVSGSPGAVMAAPYWGAAILSNGKNNVTIDATNITFENTLAGSSGATCLGGTCTQQDPSCNAFNANVCSFININGGSGVTIKNGTYTNAYVHTGTGGDGGNMDGIYFAPSALTNSSVTGPTCVNSHACVLVAYSTLSGLTLTNVTSTKQVWGIFVGDNNGGSATGVDINGANIQNFQNWAGPNLGDNGFHQDGIFFQAGNPGATFTNSDIRNSFICGPMTNPSTADIYLSSAAGVGGVNNIDIYNNLLCMPANTVGHSGDDAEGLIVIGFGAQARYVANNTATSDHTPWLDIRETGSTVTMVENNIASGTSAGAMYTAVLDKNSSSLAGKMRNNSYFNLNPAHLFQQGDGTTNYTSLAGWQGGCGCDTNSVIGDPVIVAPNYVPGTGSSSLNLGVNLTTLSVNGSGLNVDAVGNARPTTGNWTAGWKQVATAGAAQIVISPASNNFGSVTVGSVSGAQVFTVTNTGTAPGTIANAATSGTNQPDFIVGSNTCNGTTLNPNSGSCAVSITFKPSIIGGEQAVLQVGGNFTAASANLTGTGTAPATAVFTITPNPANFPNTTTGQTSPIVMTVTNTGNATGTIQNTPAFFTISNTNWTYTAGSCAQNLPLAPGAHCNLTLIFTPTTAGSFSGTLTVQSTTSMSGTATLNGTAIAPTSPFIIITPTSNAFGNQLRGSTGSPVSFTIRNTGNANAILAATPFILTGGSNPADFGRANILGSDCNGGQSLVPNATCALSFAFTPSTNGVETGGFTIKSNAPDASATFSGTGTFPAITVTPALTFGSINVGTPSGGLAVIVKNTGTGTQTFAATSLSIGGANPGDFAISSNTCSGTLAVNATCGATLTFTPASAGARSGTFLVNGGTNGASSSSPITGTGVATAPALTLVPRPLLFANTAVGSTATAVLTIQNTGTATQSSLSFSIPGTGDGPNFTQVSTDCGSTLAASATCHMTFQFAPTGSARAESTTLSITGTVSATVAMNGTGTPTGGSGSSPWSIISMSFSSNMRTVSVSGTGFTTKNKITFNGTPQTTACVPTVCTATLSPLVLLRLSSFTVGLQ